MYWLSKGDVVDDLLTVLIEHWISVLVEHGRRGIVVLDALGHSIFIELIQILHEKCQMGCPQIVPIEVVLSTGRGKILDQFKLMALLKGNALEASAFYDLVNDPWEMNNLVTDERYREEIDQRKKIIYEERVKPIRTEHPFLA